MTAFRALPSGYQSDAAASVPQVCLPGSFLAAPKLTVLWLGGMGVAISAVRATVGAYERWAGDHVPGRYADHSSKLVRFLAKLATGYGS